MKVMIVKEVITGDVSPVAMFNLYLNAPDCSYLIQVMKQLLIFILMHQIWEKLLIIIFSCCSMRTLHLHCVLKHFNYCDVFLLRVDICIYIDPYLIFVIFLTPALPVVPVTNIRYVHIHPLFQLSRPSTSASEYES